MMKRDLPAIEEVFARYGIELRRAGRDYVFLAPCHDDHHPSGRLNLEKQVWYCDPCARGGDVISFVQLVEKVSFKEVCNILKIDRRISKSTGRNWRAPTLLADWLNAQHLLIAAHCRELSRQIAVAQKIADHELTESLLDEWEVLSILHEDLAKPENAADLWALRESIERITDHAEPEPLQELPPLTDSYRAYLRGIVQ
jgi:hypothetical protein